MSLGGEHTDLFIGGQWRAASAAGRIDVVNPATEEVWASVPDADAADVDAAVRAARAALPDWRGIGAAARAEVVLRFADELAARGEGMARVITAENGTPIAETSAAASHSAGILRYFATLADLVDAVDVRPFPNAPGSYTEVSREAVGVCALIAPWNFPLGLVMVKLAPALIAGCTVVIKPAAETPLDLRVLMEAAVAAGIPVGVINVITGGRETGSLLVQHPLVDKVAFTGSTEAGRIIAQQCGSLLRPVTLELGGKSAAILLDDVDLDYFGTMLNRTCLRNTGQTCYNSTRILAPRSRYGEIVELVAGVVASTKQGDPLGSTRSTGRLSRRAARQVEGYIALGRAEGATVATGGGRPLRPRLYVQPTVFSDVDNRMRIAQEEIFGPVLVVIPFDDDSDAARIANDSQFGLGGSIFSADESRAAALARTIGLGSIGVNFRLQPPPRSVAGRTRLVSSTAPRA